MRRLLIVLFSIRIRQAEGRHPPRVPVRHAEERPQVPHWMNRKRLAPAAYALRDGHDRRSLT